jgi:hypothetical protein
MPHKLTLVGIEETTSDKNFVLIVAVQFGPRHGVNIVEFFSMECFHQTRKSYYPYGLLYKLKPTGGSLSTYNIICRPINIRYINLKFGTK